MKLQKRQILAPVAIAALGLSANVFAGVPISVTHSLSAVSGSTTGTSATYLIQVENHSPSPIKDLQLSPATNDMVADSSSQLVLHHIPPGGTRSVEWTVESPVAVDLIRHNPALSFRATSVHNDGTAMAFPVYSEEVSR